MIHHVLVGYNLIHPWGSPHDGFLSVLGVKIFSLASRHLSLRDPSHVVRMQISGFGLTLGTQEAMSRLSVLGLDFF